MTSLQKKTAAGAFAAIALAGTLAGCATSTDASSDTSTTDSSSDAATTTAPSDSSTASSTPSDSTSGSSTYKDGSYTSTGEYQSPGGQETIKVVLTLADDKVTKVTVTGTPSGPDATHYQGEFESGISSAVVGKDIDSLKVSRVAGSSLTSGGFNDALDDIKSQAAA